MRAAPRAPSAPVNKFVGVRACGHVEDGAPVLPRHRVVAALYTKADVAFLGRRGPVGEQASVRQE